MQFATVLGSVPASSYTLESEGWQMKQCSIIIIGYIEKNPKNPLVKKYSYICCPD
jgi:hypothetical protein